MTTKHTPTPWLLGQDGKMNYTIYANEHNPIAVTQSAVESAASGRSFRNAAFIVKAVNCHDDLVLALKNAMREASYLEDRGWKHHALEALAKAGAA